VKPSLLFSLWRPVIQSIGQTIGPKYRSGVVRHTMNLETLLMRQYLRGPAGLNVAVAQWSNGQAIGG
jgi:hypothetical protein